MLELYKNIPNHHLSKMGRFLLAGSIAFTFISFIIFWNNQYAFSTVLMLDTGVGFLSTVFISIGDRRALEEAKEKANNAAENKENIEGKIEKTEDVDTMNEVSTEEKIEKIE